MEKVYIGVDVGGMSIKAGVVNLNGEILFKDKVVTDGEHVDVFLDDIKKLLEKIIKEVNGKDLDVQGIGFGVPGMVDNRLGLINKMANIGGRNVPLKEYLKDLNLPIYLSNDANVAALAEQKFGIAKGMENVILLTLGTGIGGGLILNGKLYEGNEGKGAELGHVCLILNGRNCGCGRKGCLESYASATALLRMTREYMEKYKDSMMWEYCNNDINNVSGLTSFECAKKGDEAANKLIDEYVMYLGEGMLDFANIFRPEAFVIGGGISNQGEYLTEKLEKYCKAQNWGYEGAPESKVLIAKLRNDAGIIGAASLLMD